MDDSSSLRELVGRVENPATWNGKRVRALHPFEDPDRALLEVISRSEFMINGLRNKDLQPLLYTTAAKSEKEHRRRSSAVSRQLRLLRAHHLIRKVPGTHRHHLTPIGLDCSLQRHGESVHSKGRLMKSSRGNKNLIVSSTDEHG